MFGLLMFCMMICCFSLSIISPFFPPFAEEIGISKEVVGVIFSANPIGAVLAALIIGKILTNVLMLYKIG